MALAAFVMAVLALRPAASEETVRYHGFRLDGKHLLVLEQRHREIKIGVATRSRNVGNTERTRTRDENSDTTDRFGTVDYLAKITAEVLEPSAPNYLRNPGERYRFLIEGLNADPDFRSRIETDAVVARATVLGEFERLGAQTHGIQREALHYAGPYVLQVLNGSDLMPAPIPTSIQESQVGRIRFDNPALQRKSIEAGRKLYQGQKPKPTTLSPMAPANSGPSEAGEAAGQR